MRSAYLLWCAAVFVPLALVGCQDASTDKLKGAASGEEKVPDELSDRSAEEAEIRVNLQQLSPEDRKLAEDQRFCPIQDQTRLGAMDVPLKVMVKGKPIFVCCKGCVKKALAKPDKSLAAVEELRKRAAQ